MKLHRFCAAAGWIAALGCITVNINFPPKEVEKAASVIVGEARPEPGSDPGEAKGGDQPGEKPEAKVESPAGAPQGSTGDIGYSGASSFLASFPGVPAAPGEETKESEIRINIDTPVIKAIRASLVKRFEKLKSLYEKGAIGENRSGYIEVRSEEGLSLTEKRDLKALVTEETKDRKNLYLEIVKENKFSEDRLKDVEKIFAAQWAEKSRTGWWIQGKDGKWEKKKPPKDEKKKKEA